MLIIITDICSEFRFPISISSSSIKFENNFFFRRFVVSSSILYFFCILFMILFLITKSGSKPFICATVNLSMVNLNVSVFLIYI